jgi:hypothetical protein
MFQKNTMIVLSVVGLVLVSLIGCDFLDQDRQSPTAPVGRRHVAARASYNVADAEAGGWTAYYKPGDTYFKLTIPVIGAIKINYTLTQGATYTLVLKTTRPTTHQIGLMAVALNGTSVADVVDCVTLTYVENGDFVQKPANTFEKIGSQYIQYKRQTDNSETQEWWPVAEAAQFVFSAGVQQAVKPYCHGQLLVDEGKPAAPPVPPTTCGGFLSDGFCWYLINGPTCTDFCAAHGGFNTAVRGYFTAMATDVQAQDACAAILDGLGLINTNSIVDVNPYDDYCYAGSNADWYEVGRGSGGWYTETEVGENDACACLQ